MNHTHTHTHKHTRVYRFLFSFFHRAQSDNKKRLIFCIFISRCYFRIWSWNGIIRLLFHNIYVNIYLRQTHKCEQAFSSFDLQVTKVVHCTNFFFVFSSLFSAPKYKVYWTLVCHRNFEAKIIWKQQEDKATNDSVHYIQFNFDLLLRVLSHSVSMRISAPMEKSWCTFTMEPTTASNWMHIDQWPSWTWNETNRHDHLSNNLSLLLFSSLDCNPSRRNANELMISYDQFA